MSSRIEQLLGLQNELFLQRKFQAFAATYAYPLVVHIDDELYPYPSEASFIPRVAAFRDMLERHGVCHIIPKVEAIELPRKGRFRVWASWAYLRANGDVHDTNRCVIYLRSVDGVLQSEMCDYERHVAGAIPMPERKHRLA
jgi:hypothetical protein